MDIDFYEWDVTVLVYFAGERAIGPIRRDERSQGDGAGVGEEQRDLSRESDF